MEILVITFISGLICLAVPRRFKAAPGFIALAASLASFVYSVRVFLNRQVTECPALNSLIPEGTFKLDNLNAFLAPAICMFGALICLYSVGFIGKKSEVSSVNRYYACLLFTIGVSFAAVVANNLVVFLVMWGMGAFMLYQLIAVSSEDASAAAKKTFIIVGGSDAFLLLGIVILWMLAGTLQMDKIRVAVTGRASLAAFLCFMLGAFAKAGVMPLHTWIPASSEKTTAPVMAFLPASLDKLLGIYLLARCTLGLFSIEPGSGLSLLLMLTGAVTIVAAVMMALIQHNLKRLLAYHAVSQVGYMLLGIGTALPLGIAGGLFHMLNHAIYKSCLFLTGGNVEKKTGETELDRLGGLAPLMPVTFTCFIIAALSISGVPPFNGFFSKWMIYQGLIQGFAAGEGSFIVFMCLAAAMFGSALTLASFMKLAHAIFLGRKSGHLAHKRVSDAGFAMWFPPAVLAALCVIFGVFAYDTALVYFIYPAVNMDSPLLGFWHPSLATGLILLGVAVGFAIFLLGNMASRRQDEHYVGGELLPEDSRVTGVEFYRTISQYRGISAIYDMAEKKLFDIYEIGKGITFFFSGAFRKFHTGVLPTYLAWCLIGLLILFKMLLSDR